MGGATFASDQFLAAQGEPARYTDSTELSSPDEDRSNYKLIGGWDHTAEAQSGDHAAASTNITLASGGYDEIIGGNHKRNSGNEPKELAIGNTSVTIEGGSVSYAVGGSKTSTSGATTVINGDVTMTVTGGTVTDTLIGGNYLKNTNTSSAPAP